MPKRRRGQRQYRIAARRYRSADRLSSQQGQRRQEAKWASMAGPVTVRRFNPETGEAITE